MFELIKMIQERPAGSLLDRGVLPDVPLPTVSLPRERLAQFRNDYVILVQFAAAIIGVTPQELTPLHLIDHLLSADEMP